MNKLFGFYDVSIKMLYAIEILTVMKKVWQSKIVGRNTFYCIKDFYYKG